MFVSPPREIIRRNNEFVSNANENDLHLVAGLAACGESRSKARVLNRCEAIKTQQEGSMARCAVAGAA
jgi:hypothetical protein